MKTMIKSTIRTAAVCLSAALLLSGLSSCKKSATEKSKAELLTQSAWKIVKEEEKVGNGAWVNNTLNSPACDKDNNFIFKSNATFEFNEGAVKCNPADNQIIDTGKWSLENNNTLLRIIYTGNTIPDDISIEQLGENTLILLSSDDNGNGTVNYYRSTLSH
jgi:Lipocalin-like domain